jgi:hypothetical protein
MAGLTRRLRPVLGLVAILSLVVGWAATPSSALAAREPWDGSVNLYRDGVYSEQRTWLWCTAAGVQMIRNMVDGDEDHSRAGQERYFDWMRGRNRYDLPESAGVDPVGWTAGLRRFVDDRYRLQTHASFDEAVRLAVIRIRKTELPVALTVAHGTHGWILHGFTADADPLVEDGFRITSLRVTGPLWGRQNRSFGYDMRPNTKLTVKELRRFFTPWDYEPMPMAWDGRFVSIQPVTPPAAPAPEPSAAPSPPVVARSIFAPTLLVYARMGFAVR